MRKKLLVVIIVIVIIFIFFIIITFLHQSYQIPHCNVMKRYCIAYFSAWVLLLCEIDEGCGPLDNVR